MPNYRQFKFFAKKIRFPKKNLAPPDFPWPLRSKKKHYRCVHLVETKQCCFVLFFGTFFFIWRSHLLTWVLETHLCVSKMNYAFPKQIMCFQNKLCVSKTKKWILETHNWFPKSIFYFPFSIYVFPKSILRFGNALMRFQNPFFVLETHKCVLETHT